MAVKLSHKFVKMLTGLFCVKRLVPCGGNFDGRILHRL